MPDLLELELQVAVTHGVGVGNWNQGPLQEYKVLATTEPSVQFLYLVCCVCVHACTYAHMSLSPEAMSNVFISCCLLTANLTSLARLPNQQAPCLWLPSRDTCHSPQLFDAGSGGGVRLWSPSCLQQALYPLSPSLQLKLLLASLQCWGLNLGPHTC